MANSLSTRWYRSSGNLILIGLFLGIVLGGSFPKDSYPILFDCFFFCSKIFLSLIKGLIVPLLISTIIVGIAQTGDVKAVGRMGAKALLYFEIVTSIALVIGLVIGNLLKPGEGLPIDLNARVGMSASRPLSGWEIVMHAFPSNLVKHAADGDILPVVVFATLFGIALTKVGERGRPVLVFFRGVAQIMFKYTDIIMKLTPIGVFGAMASSVSSMAAGHLEDGVLIKGWSAVSQLLGCYALLVGSLYFSLAALVIIVFIPILFLIKVPVRSFFRVIREPALTAFSTASSETALPKLLEEIVRFGVPSRVAGFVIPTGYSFNLDGSTLYLVLATLTIAQAAHVNMTITQQIMIMLTFVLTSKGVAGIPRATLVIIAATCDSFHLPGEAGVAMLLAVDGVMDMARAATNVIGNALASVVVARWEGVLGVEQRPIDTEEMTPGIHL
ncbi:dicarboxylate/amino acid:cation symporter [Pajaroellobacter abortibovis]|uniref:Sodium:dicarboxylate symporter n=1 Tax=Pajaroellobacter abortibovis TaxID=1882918 RepID=A0A1L6MWF8_9BACT|nr:cation:dicarboxylase symporter family transporter [Pajaroellobacter abortibovis]APR99871.1 hypothetical protein BCY86_03645 [Pajaroellobacter abortibovis]